MHVRVLHFDAEVIRYQVFSLPIFNPRPAGGGGDKGPPVVFRK